RFAGPAAAIAAGLDTLARNGGGAPYTLVLACDMPLASLAVAALREALAGTTTASPAQSVSPPGAPPGAGSDAQSGARPGTDADTPPRARGAGGVMARAGDGTQQPLAGFYDTAGLTRACKDLAAGGRLVNGSVRALLANLDVQLVTVPSGSTADVDTWDDAAMLGIAAGNQRAGQDRRTGEANAGGNS
ncbi:MAG: molybdenum cofactor guanylyltransferase, partial [Actinomycetes bacterium]